MRVSHLVATILLIGCLTANSSPASASDMDAEVERLNRMLVEIPGVAAERRGEDVVVRGVVREESQKLLLQRILSRHPDAVDLTQDSNPSEKRMVEVDVIIVVVNEIATQSIGFDFLRLINLQFTYFHTSNRRINPGLGLTSPSSYGTVVNRTQWGTFTQASVNYNVNIANATDEAVSIVARPHLTTLNRQPAHFQSGGEIVFRVSGINNGDIKPYPFGIDLNITPTILPADDDGAEQVLLEVDASRLTVLGRLFASSFSDDVSFDKVTVQSQAVLGFDETLVLSGLYQHERRRQLSGVPYLRNIPLLKMIFSNEIEVDDVQSTVIFITPRDPAKLDEVNQQRTEDFLEYRRAYRAAATGSADDKAAFKESHPADWYQPRPNSFASHVFMLQNSQIYRSIRGEDLREEPLDESILGLRRTRYQGRN